MNELYARQQNLQLHPPAKVAIAGCGGIGSWLALDLALVGTGELCLIDPDVLELSNINRTPYYPAQVGCLKVVALAELISERRPDCLVLTYSDSAQAVFDLLPQDLDYFIDCTDALLVKQALAPRLGEKYLKLGYDGYGYVLDCTTDLPWEDGLAMGYSEVASFFAPPQLIACLVVLALATGRRLPRTVVVGDVRRVLEHVLAS